MEIKRIFSLTNVSAACSVLGLIFELLPQYRIWGIYTLASAAVLFLLSLCLRYKKTRDLRRKHSTEPRVLMLGGAASQCIIDDILAVPELRDEPYIQFVSIAIPEPNLESWLGGADALILLPDVTDKSFASEYKTLRRWARDLPLPIARFYPRDFRDAKSEEFEHLPFRTPREVVLYAAEFLLTRAVNRGRWIDSRFRLSKRTNWAALALALIGSVWVAEYFRTHSIVPSQTLSDVELYQRLVTIPANKQQDLAEILRKFRAADAESGISPLKRSQIKAVLQGWAKFQAEEVLRISDTTDSKRIYIYGLSKKQDKLVPVAGFGPEGYKLDPRTSIAGCVLQNKVVVYWAGGDENASKIRAWRLMGDQVGEYRQKEKRLILGKNDCQFENHNEPKDQLLCLPIGVDDSETSPNVPGIVCLEVNKSATSIDKPWLRYFLTMQSFALGTLDMSLLVDEPENGESAAPPTPESPFGKSPKK